MIVGAGSRADADSVIVICDVIDINMFHPTEGFPPQSNMEYMIPEVIKIDPCVCRFDFKNIEMQSFDLGNMVMNGGFDMYFDPKMCGVPEPSRAVIGLFGLMGAMVCHRRRRVRG